MVELLVSGYHKVTSL